MANNDPLELRLYDTDLTTVLGILGAASTDLYLQMNEPGSGQVKIPLNSNAAAVIASDQFVEVRYRGAVRGGFFVENIGKDEANSAEAGGQWMTISGRGAMLLLDDAIVGDDGTGASTRSFSGTKAGMIIQLIEEAQNRGGLANLDYDFTDTDDSDSVAWDDDEPLEIPVGKSLLDVVRDFAKTGIDFNVLPDGSGNFILSAYKDGIGTDKSSTVYFRIGQNCQEVSHQEAGGDIRNAIKVKYKNGFTTVKDTASISARRRREGFLDVRFAGDLSAAQTFGAAELSLKKDPKKQITVKVNDATGPKAFIKYELGDYIMLDRQGVEESHRVRGMQLSWSDSGFAEIAVDLNSLILENEIRMAQDIEWLKDMWETAHDAGLLEVRFWAAIGDRNIQYGVNKMLVVGDLLYVANSYNSSLLIYDIDAGGWTRVSIPYTPTCLANVGNDVYIGAAKKIYKYSGGTVTEVGSANLVGDPDITVVLDITAIGNKVFVGGMFDRVDGITINGVAMYDTALDTWSDIGGGGYPSVLVTDGSNIFTSNGGSVKKWNGSSWSTLGSSFSPLTVLCLAVYGTELLAGTASNVYIWDGVSWSVFEGGVSGAVWAITTILTDVYVGGSFTDRGNYIAKCSGGEWFELEEGTNGGVTDLVMHNEDLYVGGSFTTAGDKSAQGIAAYYANFDSLADYLENSEGTFNLGEAIHNATAKTSLTGADEMPLWDSISQQLRKITWTNIIASIKTWADTIYVALTGNQTVGGVKTFSSFPVTPSSAPSTNYQVANKKYVDDNIGGGGGTPGGSDTEVQFNDGGVFGGDADFVFDKTTKVLHVGAAARGVRLVPEDGDVDVYAPDGENPTFRSHAYNGVPGVIPFVAEGTLASQAAVSVGKVLWHVAVKAYNGTDYKDAGRIRAVATENHNGTSSGVKWEVYCVNNTTNTEVLVATFDQDGNINIAAGKEYRVNGAQHTHSASDITSGTLSGAILGDSIEGSTNKSTPVDADRFGFWDSVGDILKYATWANIKATLKSYFDTLYVSVTKGLAVSTASVTTSNVTGVEGTLHNLDVSGMTANRDFNLPTPSAAGVRCGVRLSVGDATYALLLKINGSEWSRIFITDEIVIFVATGTGAADWEIEQDGRIPCTAMIKNTAAESIANGTVVKINLDEEGYDNASITDEANDQINIRRTNKYRVDAAIRLNNISAAITRCYAWIIDDGGNILQKSEFYAAANSYPIVPITAQANLSAGAYVYLDFYQNSGASQNTVGYSLDFPFISVLEVFT